MHSLHSVFLTRSLQSPLLCASFAKTRGPGLRRRRDPTLGGHCGWHPLAIDSGVARNRCRRSCLFRLRPPLPLYGQPVTTATLIGTIHSPDGIEIGGASVRVINQATGYTVETQAVHGRYRVSGLEVGGPYTVRVRRIGYTVQERRGLLLSLNQQLEVDFALEPAPSTLDTVHVVMQAGRTASSHSSSGTATMISDSTLRQMPALNRDVLDFARLVPQLGTRFGGISGSASVSASTVISSMVSVRDF